MFQMNFTKPHAYFWMIALISLLTGILTSILDKSIVINIHDTYFVISYFDVCVVISILSLIIGIILWSIYKIQNHSKKNRKS